MSGSDRSRRFTYSNEEYADMLLCYGYCSGDSAAARREYIRRFPIRHIPNVSFFSTVYQQIRETGSVRGITSDVGRPRTSSEESEEEIQSFVEEPTVSTKAVAVSAVSVGSDEEAELKTEIEKILKDADLRVWTTKKVIQHLESQFGPGVWEKRPTICKLVRDYINTIDDTKDEEDETSEESETEENPKRADKSHTKSEEKEVELESDESSDDENSKAERGRHASRKPRVTEENTTNAHNYKLSPALSALMGTDEMPRPAVVKRIWAIVNENNLRDPNNRQYVICDDALLKVIGKKRFRTFAMMRYLKPHFLD